MPRVWITVHSYIAKKALADLVLKTFPESKIVDYRTEEMIAYDTQYFSGKDAYKLLCLIEFPVTEITPLLRKQISTLSLSVASPPYYGSLGWAFPDDPDDMDALRIAQTMGLTEPPKP